VPHFADGILFDLDARTTRTIPRGPLAPRARPATVWIGEELLVLFGHEHQVGVQKLLPDAALFTPAK
jgi:hypothetical protein